MLNKYGVPISDRTDERAAVLQPKFKNRFRVFFYNFAAGNETLKGVGKQGVVKTDSRNIALTGNISNFSKPTVNFAQTEVRSFIGKGSVAGRGTWENVNLSLRDDIRNAALKFILRQTYLQSLKYVPTSSVFGRNFTFSMVVEIMDGRANHTGIERWYFTGCSIASANFGDLSYDSTTEIQKIDLSVMYNNIFVSSPARIRFASNPAYNEQSTGSGLQQLPTASDNIVDELYGVIDGATDSVINTMNSFIDDGVDFVQDTLGEGYDYLESASKEAFDTASSYFGRAADVVGDYTSSGVDYVTGTISGLF